MKPNFFSTNLDDFFIEFKTLTEEYWKYIKKNPLIYGFQFQAGTRWNPGLSDIEIAKYEEGLDVRFPYDFKRMLHFMNGTDLPTLNNYGTSGHPHATSVGFYAYPRDINIVKKYMEYVETDREGIIPALKDDGYELAPEATLVPIYGHRYIVCSSDLSKSTVLSIVGTDAIVYGDSLLMYLLHELRYDSLKNLDRFFVSSST